MAKAKLHRTNVGLDKAKIAILAERLGTQSIVETVDEALTIAIRSGEGRRLTRQIKETETRLREVRALLDKAAKEFAKLRGGR